MEILLPRRSVAGSVGFGLIFVLMATVMARYLALQNEKLELDNLVMAQVMEYLEADVNMNLEMMKEQFRTGNLDNEYLQMKILCEALEKAKELKETGKEEMNDIERVEYALQKKTSQLDFGIRVKPGVTFDSLRFDAMSPNNLGAKLLVGIMCSRGSIFGLKDVEIEGPEKALEYLEQPGVRECVAAQHYIGWCYEELQEPEMMLKWYRKPAEEGYDHAQWILGKAYFYGECVPQDSVMAVEWLRKSAENGYYEAQHLYGMCLITGQGIEKNVEEGRKWLRKAAPYVPDAEIYLNAIEAVDEAEVRAVEAKKE
ncbi:MAG: tetratricopeptide repeat protein, partial [Planctomycetia bacterium]|nr:tetratricopeptide repeat protein [Planctomycetia bacterium]